MSHRTGWLMYCVLVLLMCVVSVRVALALGATCSGGCCKLKPPAVPCTDPNCTCENVSSSLCNGVALPDECY
jgi:hypothetical protein